LRQAAEEISEMRHVVKDSLRLRGRAQALSQFDKVVTGDFRAAEVADRVVLEVAEHLGLRPPELLARRLDVAVYSVGQRYPARTPLLRESAPGSSNSISRFFI
jgi:hypothetical protein